MSGKSPISILQEYAVKQKMCLPDFDWQVPDAPGGQFQCSVKVGHITATGYGSNKQIAKTCCATKALEQFGLNYEVNNNNNGSNQIPLEQYSPTKVTGQTANYVGILNETASLRKVPYPEYTEVLRLGQSFEINCDFLEWKTVGFGLTKKMGKQEAAKKMLDIIKDHKEFPVHFINKNELNMTVASNENSDHITERIKEKIKIMSLNPTGSHSMVVDDVIPQIVAGSQIKTFQQLRHLMTLKGYVTKIETLQSTPWIVMLKIEGNVSIVMGQGPTKEEAYEDLFQTTLILFVKDYNFKSYFEEKLLKKS